MRRGGRDHTSRPLLYFTFPGVTLGGHRAEAVCVSECPLPPLPATAEAAASSSSSSSNMPRRQNASATAAVDDPSQYVCVGTHYGTGADRCASSTAGSSCEPPAASSLFSEVGSSELNKCDDPMQLCNVCYPPYRTVPLGTYCLPDPQHALETFSTVVTAFGAIGASVDGRMTLKELEEMRSFVASAPHILWEV